MLDGAVTVFENEENREARTRKPNDCKDNEGKDIMDYIHSNKKCADKLEEKFSGKFFKTNETLGVHAEGGRTSYLKM